MLVAGDEDSALRLGEREQVVVARIGGAARWRLGVGREPYCLPQKLDKRPRLVFCDALVDLRIGERSREFGEKRLGDDELELACEPTRNDLRGRSASGEERGDEDVRVEDGTHSAAAGPSLVLRLDGEFEGLPLA